MERLSDREKYEIVRLSASGLPSRLIGAQIGRHHRTVLDHLARLRRPAVREPVRSPLRLSLTEREEISRGLAGGVSLRAIARRLARSPSTISREVATNGGRRRYRACRADKAAVGRMRRPKPSKLATCARLRAIVEDKLEVRWSPTQISGWLVDTFPDDPEMRVSHETIYLSLFVQSRGALRKGADALSAIGAHNAPVEGPHGDERARPVARRAQYSGAAGRGRRPGRAWPMGRRSAVRQTDEGDRDVGGAQDPFRHVDCAPERPRR